MLSYNCQKEINKLHKRKGYKAMINFKKTLSINDIALSIKKDVDYAILYYNSNNSGWKTYVRMSYYQFRTLCLIAIESDIFSEYEELARVTQYRKLYQYKEISNYIHRIVDVEK